MTSPPAFPWHRMATLLVGVLAVVGSHIYFDVRRDGRLAAVTIVAGALTLAVFAGIAWLLHYLWMRRSKR